MKRRSIFAALFATPFAGKAVAAASPIVYSTKAITGNVMCTAGGYDYEAFADYVKSMASPLEGDYTKDDVLRQLDWYLHYRGEP